MNNSSSWDCFSWNRRGSNAKSEAEKKTPKQPRGEIPDEQFANLLGGEC